MSFSTLVLLGVILLILTQLYFVLKIAFSLRELFPRLQKKTRRRILWFYSLLHYSYPLSALGVLLYTQVDPSKTLQAPQNTLFDYFFVYPFWIMLLIFVQNIVILIPLNIIITPLKLVIKNKKEIINNYWAKFIFILLIASIVYVPVRVYYDHNYVSTRIVEYSNKNIPSELNGTKIVLISDIQADRYTGRERLDHYIQTANSIEADLILIAGDMITNTPNYINKAAETVGKLKARNGVYSCVGDHDNWAYRWDILRSRREVIDALAKYNVKMGDNEHETVNINGTDVLITFITYTYSDRINESTLDSVIAAGNNAEFKIFLTHQPRPNLIESAEKHGYNLFLCGHTHGGQVSFIFPFIYLTPTLIETKYVRGDFWFNNMLMIVNRGLGMSLAPVRYNSTPEVTLITLSNK